jgi:hypothetical protein
MTGLKYLFQVVHELQNMTSDKKNIFFQKYSGKNID